MRAKCPDVIPAYHMRADRKNNEKQHYLIFTLKLIIVAQRLTSFKSKCSTTLNIRLGLGQVVVVVQLEQSLHNPKSKIEE